MLKNSQIVAPAASFEGGVVLLRRTEEFARTAARWLFFSNLLIDTRTRLVYPSQPMTYEHIDDTAWDALCKRCGQCCFEKIENERGTIFYTQTPCRYLDVVSRQCKVYDRRATINPSCIKLTPELLGQLRWLHPDCGYRRAFPELNPAATEAEKRVRKSRKPQS